MIGRIAVLAACAAGTAYVIKLREPSRRTLKPSFMPDSIEHFPNQLTFNWLGNEGGRYRVYRGRKLVYEGKETGFTDQGLKPGTLYTYTIEEETNEGLKIMKIQTATSRRKQVDEHILKSLIVTTVVSDERVSLFWEPIEGIEEYAIYRNGAAIGLVKENFFIDEDVQGDKDYTYSIIARRPLRKSEERVSSGKFVLSGLLGIVKKNSSKEMTAYESFTITKNVGRINDVLQPVQQQQQPRAPDEKWHLRYSTFLSEEMLKNPNPTSNLHFFKGDGRRFDPNSSHFRTRADIYIDMQQEEPSVDLKKQVGQTTAYNLDHEFAEEGRASDETIELSRVLHANDSTIFEVSHSVSNPLVVAPSIDYHVQAAFYETGGIDIVGIHDQSPNHEVYLKADRDTSWQTIHLALDKGLEMLSYPTANQYWRYSTIE